MENRIVQIQVVIENLQKPHTGDYYDIEVMFALDEKGNIWRKAWGKWTQVEGPENV